MAEEEIVANVRRRVFAVMNKGRDHFDATPAYDDFLETREDLIREFVELHTSESFDPQKAAVIREALNRRLNAYEEKNEEQILATRAVEDERKRQQLKSIVQTEGLFYERVNAEFHHRNNVFSHPLEFQDVAPTLPGQKTAPRRTRLMPGASPVVISLADSMACTVEPAGVAGLWVKRVQQLLEKYKSSFS